MGRQHQGRHVIIPEDISDNRSVWPKKVRAGTLLHGGGLLVRRWEKSYTLSSEHVYRIIVPGFIL